MPTRSWLVVKALEMKGMQSSWNECWRMEYKDREKDA